MVELVIKTIDGRTETVQFGHGRKAIADAEAMAVRMIENRWVRETTVTGKLDF